MSENIGQLNKSPVVVNRPRKIGDLNQLELLSYASQMNTPEQILDDFRMEIQKGLDNLKSGDFRDGSDVMAEIKNRLDEMKAKENYEHQRIST